VDILSKFTGENAVEDLICERLNAAVFVIIVVNDALGDTERCFSKEWECRHALPDRMHPYKIMILAGSERHKLK